LMFLGFATSWLQLLFLFSGRRLLQELMSSFVWVNNKLRVAQRFSNGA